MISVIRTTADDFAFKALITELDNDLLLRYGPKQSQYDVHNTGLRNARVVLALEQDKPVGCGCYKVLESADKIEIKRMYVQPAYRQLGAAQQVLAQLEAWAQEENYRMAILQTASKQPESIALYQRCGYESIPCYGVYIGDADSVCMQKMLR